MKFLSTFLTSASVSRNVNATTLNLLTIKKIYCMEHLLYDNKRGDLASSLNPGFPSDPADVLTLHYSWIAHISALEIPLVHSAKGQQRVFSISPFSVDSITNDLPLHTERLEIREREAAPRRKSYYEL